MDTTPSVNRLEQLLAHRAWVRRIARALFLDENRADDLEQEVWLDALRAAPPRSPRAWLGTVIRRVAATMRRSEGRRASHEQRAPVSPPPPDPGEWIEQAETIEQLVRTVRTLEEPYRTTLFLRYFEDLGPAAIAARLGVPVETVRTRLRRGLDRVRRRLDAGKDGDRRKWAMLLFPLARRPAPVATGAAVIAGATGAALMTLKSKAVIVAAVVVVLAGVVLLPGPSRPDEEPVEPRTSINRPAVAENPTSPPASPPAGAREVETASSRAGSPEATAGTVAVGRILDEATGEPIPGARVSLVFHLARLDPEREPSAVTDGDGRFRIEGIDKRARRSDSLLVFADGYAEHLRSIYGWGRTIVDEDPADLGEIRIERGASVTGRVLDVDGAPVTGAVVLFCKDTPLTHPASFTPRHSVRAGVTDAIGRYSVERIPSARAPGYHTLFAVSGRSIGWLSLPAVAGRKDLADQEVRLLPTATIAVTVRGPDGPPLVGVLVVAEPHFRPLGARSYDRPVHGLWIGRSDLKPIFEGRTDDGGRVRLDRLPVAGDGVSYDVVAYADGMDRGAKDRVRVTPGATVEVMVDLRPEGTATLSGTVRDAEGQPVAGARINFVGSRTVTDAEGAYRVEGVNPSTMNFDPWMTVDAEGYAKASREFKRPERWDAGGVDFVLERAVPVKGIVVDEEGQPLAGVQVTLECAGAGVDTDHTAADGRFALRLGEDREARLSLYPPRPFTDWTVPEEVPVPTDGSEMRVVLTKAPTGTRVVVEVRDSVTGQPLDPTRADLYPANRDSRPRTYGFSPRIESGRVVFERVLPGNWIAWVGTEGRAPARLVLRVDEGQEVKTATVRCGPPGTVRGRLEGGPPLTRRGMVFLSPVDGESRPQWVKLQSNPRLIRAAHVETDRTFLIEGVPPGRLRIWTESGGFRGEVEVEVRAGMETTAVVRLEATARAKFRTGEPPTLPVVEVRFAGEGGEWSRWHPFAGRGERLPEWATSVPSGRVRWEARFRTQGAASAPDAPATARGTCEARIGETVEVVIPVR